MFNNELKIQGKENEIKKVREFLQGANPLNGNYEELSFTKIKPIPSDVLKHHNVNSIKEWLKINWAILLFNDSTSFLKELITEEPFHRKEFVYRFQTQNNIEFLIRELGEKLHLKNIAVDLVYKCYSNENRFGVKMRIIKGNHRFGFGGYEGEER